MWRWWVGTPGLVWLHERTMPIRSNVFLYAYDNCPWEQVAVEQVPYDKC